MSEWVKEVVTEHAKSLGHGVESERLSFSPCSDIYYLYSQEGVTLPLWTSVSSSAKTLLLNRVVIRVKWHNAWKELKIRPGSEWSSGNISDYHNCFQQGLWWEELRKTGGIYLFPSNYPTCQSFFPPDLNQFSDWGVSLLVLTLLRASEPYSQIDLEQKQQQKRWNFLLH